jgi:hypothetical protein
MTVFLWLRAPVLAYVTYREWLAVGLVVEATIAGIGVAATRSLVGVILVSVIGLVAGVAYVDSSISDIPVGLVGAVVSSLAAWREFHLPWIAGAFAGAFVAHISLRRPTRPERAKTGGL